MPQDDLEAELERAFEGFQATRLVDIMGGTHRSNPTVGRTPLVVLIEDHSNPNLENMIAYLERNKGKMPYSELVDKHIEIVRYFTRIAHLQIPGVQELREQELEALFIFIQETRTTEKIRRSISYRQSTINTLKRIWNQNGRTFSNTLQPSLCKCRRTGKYRKKEIGYLTILLLDLQH